MKKNSLSVFLSLFFFMAQPQYAATAADQTQCLMLDFMIGYADLGQKIGTALKKALRNKKTLHKEISYNTPFGNDLTLKLGAYNDTPHPFTIKGLEIIQYSKESGNAGTKNDCLEHIFSYAWTHPIIITAPIYLHQQGGSVSGYLYLTLKKATLRIHLTKDKETTIRIDDPIFDMASLKLEDSGVNLMGSNLISLLNQFNLYDKVTNDIKKALIDHVNDQLRHTGCNVNIQTKKVSCTP